MSEELISKRLVQNGLKFNHYEFYNVNRSSLNSLKKYKAIPPNDYGKYSKREPDGLLVDRRNLKDIKVIIVIEHKQPEKFKTKKDIKSAIEQCNDLCQELDAKIGVITDSNKYVWINPNCDDKQNTYIDRTSKKERSYSIIINDDNTPFSQTFHLNEDDNNKPSPKQTEPTLATLKAIDTILKAISSTNSKLITSKVTDPTSLARQIWQDVWAASGAQPEKCLYTFVELFIFKYLSDLGILGIDDKGNNINFQYILKLSSDVAFKNYFSNVRPHLKKMFPENPEDSTTIINGTVLSPNVPEHSQVFHNILKKFDKFGELKNIDPDFKTKLFEQFMKESISKKNWGQFFTPRTIVDSIIEMSDIDKLPVGSKICDPACGVGGFILQPIKVKNNGLEFYYKIEKKKIVSRFQFIGYDKGFEKEEQLTIILAKANMLIYLSDLLKEAPSLSVSFSQLFSDTFKLINTSILGSLANNKEKEYDLIMTNPPYAQKGSKNLKDAINANGDLRDFFKIDGNGVEGLFIEKIIRELKEGRKAFIIAPHSIFDRVHDLRLREFIAKECIIDAIISLPQKTFYKTLKKTYILCLTRKENNEIIQTDPIFSCLVTEIGESLDIYRSLTPDRNDLPNMVQQFKYFMINKAKYKSNSPKIKTFPFKQFEENKNNWCVDRWWSKDEKIRLGVEKEDDVVDFDQYKTRINEAENKLKKLYDGLMQKESESVDFATEPLSEIFTIKQGDAFYTKKRILSENWVGEIPVYSSNTRDDGLLIKIKEEAIRPKDKYYGPCLTWSIDGNWAGKIFVRNEENIENKKSKKYLFTINNHCGVLIPNKKDIDLGYARIVLGPLFKNASRAYNNEKVGTNQINGLEIKIPIDVDGKYDVKKQKEIADNYEEIERVKNEIKELFSLLSDVQIELL